MKRGVIGLETFIHTKFVCVGNHTPSLTTPKVARPLPKHLASLSMEVIMNVTPLVGLKQSPWSDRSIQTISGLEGGMLGGFIYL